ncbi:aminotransferase class IV [Motilibacter peucedani]|uniref:aminotransferase class IV n=1 Tax=Motilibacter peucedani TaxID=598650 RepID=UPI000EB362C7|nr:aminotransferase class IV [Motilibacter peucedani]
MTVWVQGRILPAEDAVVGVLDHGFTVGDGVFETVRVSANVPIALSRHLARLTRSATALGLPAPDLGLVRAAVDDLLSGVPTASPHRLRITVTSGPGPLGSARGDSEPTLVVALVAAAPWPADCAVVTVPWVRNERSPLAGVKSTSYAENAVALEWAHQRGAQEALIANTRGELCEGTGSNVFVVVDGQLLTPSLRSGCLAGVTRGLVLEVSDAQEADLPLGVLEHAEEVFITSATRGAMPVTRVDGRELAAGPVTAEVAAAYAALLETTPDP